jgi:hypothetical protein
MNVVSLLILWSISILSSPQGGGCSFALNHPSQAGAGFQAARALTRPHSSRIPFSDPSGGRQAASFEEEDDSVEDDLSPAEQPLSAMLGAGEQGSLVSFALSRHRALPSHLRVIPLRC